MQIQLLKPSTKAAKIIDISASADDNEAAAAALTTAAAAAADMSKELLGSLPLDEVKKRTVLQQQVIRCIALCIRSRPLLLHISSPHPHACGSG